MFFYYVGYKKKLKDSTPIYEVLLVGWSKKLKKVTTYLWTIWNNQVLFFNMLEKMKSMSSQERPLLLYSDNGQGVNGCYELQQFQPNKYSLYQIEGEETPIHTQACIMLNKIKI
jgi:hypothetical protein